MGGLPEELYDLFEKGYSTKGDGRGFGLYRLRQEVQKFGEKVYAFESFRKDYHQQYLVIYIEFTMKENAKDYPLSAFFLVIFIDKRSVSFGASINK